MKKFISIFFVFNLFCLFPAIAQRVNINNNSELKADTVNKQFLDNAKYRIYYLMRFSQDTLSLDSKTEAQTLLLIGSRNNAFLDYNSLRKDSVYDALSKEKANSMEIFSKVFSIGKLIKFSPTIIKNYPKTGNFTFQQIIASRDEYRYTEPNIKINWTLQNEENEVLGYKCKKAICNFRGRDYEAWYCPDIPISEGPYVFSGLPGLILEISDTKDHYKFTMNGINEVKGYDPIYLRTNNVVETSRNNVRKAISNAKNDPASILKTLTNASVSEEVIAKLQPKPYNPIELE